MLLGKRIKHQLKPINLAKVRARRISISQPEQSLERFMRFSKTASS